MPSIFAIALKGLRALNVLIVLKMDIFPRPVILNVFSEQFCVVLKIYFVLLVLTNNTGNEIDNRDSNNDEVKPAPGVAKVSHDPHGHQLEAGLEEEDHGEDLVEVVEGVHQPRLGTEPHVLQGHHETTQ